MPFAQIHMLEGRTEDQKRAVIEKVTQALHEAVGAPRETIRHRFQRLTDEPRRSGFSTPNET